MLSNFARVLKSSGRRSAARQCCAYSSLPITVRSLLKSNSLPGASIQLHGWVQSLRKQKQRTFLNISDGSHSQTVQAVIPTGTIAVPSNLTYGASVRLVGNWQQSPGAGQAMELQVEKVEVLGECDPDLYPIQRKSLSVEHLRDHAHLRMRYPSMAATMRLRNTITSAIHDFFQREDFVHVHTPVISSSDCEGAGETFQLAESSIMASKPVGHDDPISADTPPEYFFCKPAYLTVSHQLHLEALTHSLPRVYTLSPCFRAETSQTSRHLSEFYMLEAEVAFLDALEPLMHLTEAAIKHALIISQRTAEFDLLWGAEGSRLSEAGFEMADWVRITYDDAIRELLSASGDQSTFQYPISWGMDLRSEHEKWLVENVGKGPLFVTNYPEDIKPFYMLGSATSPSEGPTVANFDLLVPRVLELCGGSLRKHDLQGLKTSMVQRRLLARTEAQNSENPYSWYLDLRKYGSTPHGGFGLGFDRLVSWIGGIDSLKECTSMPRWAGRMLV